MKVTPELNSTRDEGVKRESVSLEFARRVLIATLVVASVVLVLLFIWYAADLLMLVFAGVLVSILLRGFTRLSVELPPVLTITAQVLLGLVFGFIGLLLASPLMAAVMILVKMLYVEDVIGDRVMREGGEAGGEERAAKRAGDAGDV